MPTPPPLPAINPYAAPDAVVEEVSTSEIELASRGTRLIAAIVDGLIFFIPYMAMIMAMPVLIGESADAALAPGAMGVLGVIGMIALVAVNLRLLHRYGQTIGKRMFGIKVLRSDGSRCSLARIVFARWLPVTIIGFVPVIGAIFSLVDALVIFREEQRCVHDYIADTIVTRA